MNKITMKTIKANRKKFVLCDWCGAEYDPLKSAVLYASIALSNGKARASKPVIKAIREFGFPIYNKRKGKNYVKKHLPPPRRKRNAD